MLLNPVLYMTWKVHKVYVLYIFASYLFWNSHTPTTGRIFGAHRCVWYVYVTDLSYTHCLSSLLKMFINLFKTKLTSL